MEQKLEEVLKKGEKSKKSTKRNSGYLHVKLLIYRKEREDQKKRQYDFIATKVEVFNTETQQCETSSFVNHDELPLKETDSNTT